MACSEMQSDLNKTSVNKTSRSTTAPPARRRRPPTERESSLPGIRYVKDSDVTAGQTPQVTG